jgi:leucyl aminopeptidase (aminopeptidase T)
MDNNNFDFQKLLKSDLKLKRSANVAVRDVLKIKKGEKVIIVTNPDKESFPVSQALFDASAEAGADPLIIIQNEKTQLDFTEDGVIGAIKSEPDVFISISKNKLGKDRDAIINPYEHEGKKYNNTFHYLMHGIKKCRSFWSPGITRDMFIRTVPVNYDNMNKNSLILKNLLDKAVELKITSPAGTDVTVGINGRQAMCDDGDFSHPGSGGNLPAGETFISPVVGKTEGIIVFDGSMSTNSGDILINTPIIVSVKNGFAEEIKGAEEAEALIDTIEKAEKNAILFEKEGKLPAGDGKKYKKNARNIGELGIGLNPEAIISGNMLEDEKAFKTCHFAIGSNYDEDAPSLIHLDGLVKEPTIVMVFEDGSEKTVIKDGVLV